MSDHFLFMIIHHGFGLSSRFDPSSVDCGGPGGLVGQMVMHWG